MRSSRVINGNQSSSVNVQSPHHPQHTHHMSPGFFQNIAVTGGQQPFPPPRPYPPRSGSAAAASESGQHLLPVPFEGWLPLLFLAIALYCVVFAIIDAKWVGQAPLLLYAPGVGLLVGFGISKIPRFPQSILHLAACLLGHWFAIWLTSVVAFHISWLTVLLYLRSAFTGELVGMGLLASEVIFFFYLTFLCFFLGYFGSWLVYRAHLPWLVILVYAAIMLVNLNYVNQDESYLVVTMVAALILLVARMHLTAQIAQWTREGLHTDREWTHGILRRCMQIACIIAVVAMLGSIILPVLEQPESGKTFWDRLDNAWTNLLSGHFSLQDLSSLTNLNQPATNFFGDQLTITNSVRLPVGDVITYKNVDGVNDPHYLEGFTYNHFDGRTWTNSSNGNASHSYGPNDLLPLDFDVADLDAQKVQVTIKQPPDGTKAYIFAPAQPRTFSVSTTLYNDGTVSAWTQQNRLKDQTYTVSFVAPTINSALVSLFPISLEGKNTWRTDGNYPTIPQEYLQVPGNLSPQVGQRVLDWTRDTNDAYSALKSLEKHLSDPNVFTYKLDNPAVPANTDPITWLLQNRSGYCTHYATAMAIMARQLGIPTRIVNGFSQGHLDPKTNEWVVEGTDAHSWVQAYFPGYGWLSFDPTPSFSPGAAPNKATLPPPTPTPVVTPPARPSVTPTPASKVPTPANTRQQNPKNALSTNKEQESGNMVVWMVLSIIVLLLVLGFLIFVLVRQWWSKLYANSPFAARAYWRFCRIAGWFGLAPRKWQTPYEYSAMLSAQLPQQALPFRRLTDMFVHERWGSPLQAPQAQDVQQLWPSLRSLLFRLVTNKMRGRG